MPLSIQVPDEYDEGKTVLIIDGYINEFDPNVFYQLPMIRLMDKNNLEVMKIEIEPSYESMKISSARNVRVVHNNVYE